MHYVTAIILINAYLLLLPWIQLKKKKHRLIRRLFQKNKVPFIKSKKGKGKKVLGLNELHVFIACSVALSTTHARSIYFLNPSDLQTIGYDLPRGKLQRYIKRNEN